jgi:2-polyprenyl-3-methyl-5-hydroxy-6-metoxy-1,4-benzoquinol methylase
MRCIICGKSNWDRLYESHDRLYNVKGIFFTVRCRTCKLIRTDPQLKSTGLKKYYPPSRYYSYSAAPKPGFFGRLRSYLILHLNRPTPLSRLLEIFIRVPAMPHNVSTGKILDIGCGSGDTLSLLKSVGWDVYGLDIDNGAIKVARERGLDKVSLGSYEDLKKYPDNYFDAIRLYHVIEHLDNPENCLKLAHKKLKPGGEIIIGTPNISSLVARIFRQYWYNLDCPRHLYLFSPQTLRALVLNSKYKTPKIRFCSAAGWVGSIQYVFEDVLSKDIDLVNRAWLVMIFYPLEWILDKIGVGDVFELSAEK